MCVDKFRFRVFFIVFVCWEGLFFFFSTFSLIRLGKVLLLRLIFFYIKELKYR